LRELERKGYDQEKINEEFKGMTIVTLYSKAGKHTYKIEKIDFQKSPIDWFN
jgi:broad-specificity NMP kinase